MQRHRKTFRAFNGKECWDEPLTLHPPEGYVGKHRCHATPCLHALTPDLGGPALKWVQY